MNIIVGTTKEQSTTEKGAILESLAKDLLMSLGYVVYQNIRLTGTEIDLLCHSDTNNSKIIYVECKAYGPENKINNEVLLKLFGVRQLHKYDEAWLISTSELGKDAKGIVDETSKGDDAKYFTFITPDKLVSSLVNSKIIQDSKIACHDLTTLIPESRMAKSPVLLFTDYGYFWIFEYLPHGKVTGYIFYDSQSSQVITDEKLLDKLSNIEQLDDSLDFSTVLEILVGNEASRLKTNSLSLNPEYNLKIDTMKFKIQHSGTDELKISDVFVYPDLDLNSDSESSVKNSLDILQLKIANQYIIFGDDLSGKTTLLQQYQKHFVGKGCIPLFINAAEIKIKTLAAFEKLLELKFTEQINSNPEYLRYFNSVLANDKDKILILIDDLQNIGIKQESSQIQFMALLLESYKNCIITVHSSSEMILVAKSEWKQILSDYSQYNILQLGHVKRDLLIEKWLCASDENISDEDLHNLKSDIANKINVATGKSFIPTHPFYLLTLLQLLENGSGAGLKGTKYGELYTFLIINALGGANAKSEDLDFYITYLSKLAFKLFVDNKPALDEILAERFFNDYIEEMCIQKEYLKVHKLLINARLLVDRDDGVAFQFSYMRFYFVAKYLSDNFNDESVKQLVSSMVSNLHKDRYANIIIFLIHHSKNTDLIKAILVESKNLFSGVEAHSLSKEEMAKFNALLSEQITPELKNDDPKTHRKRELEIKDKYKNDNRKDDVNDIDDTLDLFGKIQYSFRLLEVLGQIANNYYGSIDGKTKIDIVNELYNLGLRSMNALLNEYQEYIDGLKDEIKKVIISKKGKQADIDKMASDVVYEFTQIIVFAYIKKISESIMSKNLFPVLNKLEHEQNHHAKHLVTAAIKLNFPDELINVKEDILSLFEQLEKNYIPQDVLKYLVVNHLYKYHVKHSLKQSICDNLKIKVVHPNNKMLTATSS